MFSFFCFCFLCFKTKNLTLPKILPEVGAAGAVRVCEACALKVTSSATTKNYIFVRLGQKSFAQCMLVKNPRHCR